MNPIQAAMYARVSSDQQSQAHTIQSQVSALRARIAADDAHLAPDNEFVDDGYSGSTLVRPALERLRDAVAIAVAGTFSDRHRHWRSSF